MSKSIQVKTPVAIASFPKLFTPAAFEGQEPKYSVMLGFTPDADMSQLKAAALAVAKKKWGDRTASVLKANPVFRNHDDEVEQGKKSKGFPEGTVFFTARSKNPIPVFARKGDDTGLPVLISEEEGTTRGHPREIYGGARVRAIVSVYAYDKAGNQGVGFGLEGVQKWEDGPRLDGASDVASMFDFEVAADADLEEVMCGDEWDDDLTDLL
jgi:hypothetical protein